MSEESKHKRQKKTLNRINRIQGQLNGLKSAIDADTECEDIVIQAHAIEKAVRGLMLHIVGGYFENQAKDLLTEDPEAALESLHRLFELSHR